MRRHISPFAGMAVCVLVFTITVAVSKSLLVSLLFGVGAGVAAALIVRGLFPSGDGLDEYRLDARRRVKKLLETNERVRKLARNVQDSDAKAALEAGCKIIPDLVLAVQNKQPGSVASTAARVQNHLAGIETTLTNYLEIQANPEYVLNGTDRLRRGNQGFKDFRSFALTSIQQVNEGNMTAYEATLEALAPLPELSA